MKHLKLFPVLLVSFLISCEKPMFPDNAGDDNPNLVVSVYQMETTVFPVANTRAELSQFCSRFNFAVYDSVGTRVRQVNQEVGDKSFGTAGFQLPQGKYQVVVVGHSSNGNPTMTNPAKIQFKNSQGFTDTFLSNNYVNIDESEVSFPVSLSRIVSLCRFVITDPIPANVTQMRFQYKGGSGAFDASTGLGSVNSTQTEYFPVEAGHELSSFDLYTFLHADEGTIHLQATAYDANDNVVNDREFDVPLQRRKITKLIGSYFTGSGSSGMTIIIDINADWEGEDIIKY